MSHKITTAVGQSTGGNYIPVLQVTYVPWEPTVKCEMEKKVVYMVVDQKNELTSLVMIEGKRMEPTIGP